MIDYPVAQEIHGELAGSDVLFRLFPVGGVDVFFQIALFIQFSQQAKRLAISIIHCERRIGIQLVVREIRFAFNNARHIVDPVIQRPLVFEVGSERNDSFGFQLFTGGKEFVPGLGHFGNAGIGECFFVVYDTGGGVARCNAVELAFIGFEIFKGNLVVQAEIVQGSKIFWQIGVRNGWNEHHIRKLSAGHSDLGLLVVVGLGGFEFHLDVRIFLIKALYIFVILFADHVGSVGEERDFAANVCSACRWFGCCRISAAVTWLSRCCWLVSGCRGIIIVVAGTTASQR
ncbi:hypothetical protein D3C73_927250 [compost metagenome]